MSQKVTSQLEEAVKRHQESVEKMDDIDAKLQSLPDTAEEKELEFHRSSFAAQSAETERWSDTIKRLRAIRDARQAIPEETNDEDTNADSPVTKRISVREKLTYADQRGPSFFRDLHQAGKGNGEAQKRLDKHQSEMAVEMRDLTTVAGDGGELVPPLWVQSEFVDLARASRPLANAVANLPLPPNTMSINLPTQTGGATVAPQATENTGVSETDIVTSSVSGDVVTIAGMQDVSLQLFERGQPGLDSVISADLARAYATKIDTQVLYGAAGSGEVRGLDEVSSINSVTYTDASPTLPELRAKIAEAISDIWTETFRSPDLIVMHPRRWGWALAQNDTTGRPLITADGAPMNAAARFDRVAPENLVGQMLGLPVLLDASIKTTIGASTAQDEVWVLSSQDLYLYEEGAPRIRVFEDVGSGTLTVRVRVQGYAAFIGNRRPKTIAQINGTGLHTP